jgi:hypothetical protein
MCLDTTIKKQLPNQYPQFIMGVLAQAKNGDEQFWKQKFHEKKCTQSALIFFRLSLRGGGGVEDFSFFLCSKTSEDGGKQAPQFHHFPTHGQKGLPNGQTGRVGQNQHLPQTGPL